eukprot:1161835-Pelagomonas_calceolata.AAC.18
MAASSSSAYPGISGAILKVGCGNSCQACIARLFRLQHVWGARRGSWGVGGGAWQRQPRIHRLAEQVCCAMSFDIHTAWRGVTLGQNFLSCKPISSLLLPRPPSQTKEQVGQRPTDRGDKHADREKRCRHEKAGRPLLLR